MSSRNQSRISSDQIHDALESASKRQSVMLFDKGEPRISVRRGLPLAFAVLESICVFLIGLGKLGILVGVATLLAAEKASSFHSEKFRIPILLLAVIGAVVNLYSVWNFHRLRNAASAAWRRRPLTGRQKTKHVLLVLFSVVALLLVGAEIYVHPLFGK